VKKKGGNITKMNDRRGPLGSLESAAYNRGMEINNESQCREGGPVEKIQREEEGKKKERKGKRKKRNCIGFQMRAGHRERIIAAIQTVRKEKKRQEKGKERKRKNKTWTCSLRSTGMSIRIGQILTSELHIGKGGKRGKKGEEREGKKKGGGFPLTYSQNDIVPFQPNILGTSEPGGAP